MKHKPRRIQGISMNKQLQQSVYNIILYSSLIVYMFALWSTPISYDKLDFLTMCFPIRQQGTFTNLLKYEPYHLQGLFGEEYNILYWKYSAILPPVFYSVVQTIGTETLGFICVHTVLVQCIPIYTYLFVYMHIVNCFYITKYYQYSC